MPNLKKCSVTQHNKKLKFLIFTFDLDDVGFLGLGCARNGSAASFCAGVNLAGIEMGICFVGVSLRVGFETKFFKKDELEVEFLILDEIYEQGSVDSDVEIDLIDDEYIMI